MDVTILRKYYIGLSLTSVVLISYVLIGPWRSSLQRSRLDNPLPQGLTNDEAPGFTTTRQITSDLDGPNIVENASTGSSPTQTGFSKAILKGGLKSVENQTRVLSKVEKNGYANQLLQKRKKAFLPKAKPAEKRPQNSPSHRSENKRKISKSVTRMPDETNVQRKLAPGRKSAKKKANVNPKQSNNSNFSHKSKNSSTKKKQQKNGGSEKLSLPTKKTKFVFKRVESRTERLRKKQERKSVVVEKPKHPRHKSRSGSSDKHWGKSSKNENQKRRQDATGNAAKTQSRENESSEKIKKSSDKDKKRNAKGGKSLTRSSHSKLKAGGKRKHSYDSRIKMSSKKEDEERRRRDILKKNPIYSDKVINPHPFHFVNKSSDCSEHAPNGEVFLLVLVACRPGEDKDRQWIRDTWGSVLTYRNRAILVRFLVGRDYNKRAREMVAEESSLHNDIVQENFVDTYRNMTHKVLMGLKWAAQMCPNASYVMNLDSDMFLNVFRLVDRLERAPRRNFAEGHPKVGSRPIRSRRYKWYTPFEMYAETRYPPYLNGPAYVMSGDLPGRLFNASAYVRYLPWDDAFIGLVMKKLRTRIMNGRIYEVPLRSRNPFVVLRTLLNSIATTVGHQRPTNFVLRDIWRNFLGNYHNYTYDPPEETRKRLNISDLIEYKDEI